MVDKVKLEDVQLGQELVVYGVHSMCIVKVTRLTKTQIVVKRPGSDNEYKFNKFSGKEVGGDRSGWYRRDWIKIPIEADYENIKRSNLVSTYRKKLNTLGKVDYTKLSTEELEKVNQMLDEIIALGDKGYE